MNQWKCHWDLINWLVFREDLQHIKFGERKSFPIFSHFPSWWKCSWKSESGHHPTIWPSSEPSAGAGEHFHRWDSQILRKGTPLPPPRAHHNYHHNRHHNCNCSRPQFFSSTGGGDFSWPNFRHQYHGPRMPPPSNNAVFMTAFINKKESWIRQ